MTATPGTLEGAGTVLITGATGFLGQHLVQALLDGGLAPGRLRLLGRHFPAPLRALGCHLVEGSLLDGETLAAATQGAGLVYHLAGQVSRRREDARGLHELHVEGTRRLCERLVSGRGAAAPARLVLASTSGTIAVRREPPAAGEPELLDESAGYPFEVVAGWPYYLSKIYQEQTALRFHRDQRLEVVVCNPSLLLGPGDDRGSSTGDVLAFLRGEIPAVPDGGVSFVDVRDVAQAFVAAALRGRPGERYLLGGPNWTMAEFLARLERASGLAAPRIGVPRRVAGWVQRGLRLLDDLGVLGDGERKAALDPVSAEMATAYWWFSSEKAAAELGFVARDPGETLAATIKDLRARHGLSRPGDDTGGDDDRFVPWAGAPVAADEPGQVDNPWRPRGKLGARWPQRDGGPALTGSTARRWRPPRT